MKKIAVIAMSVFVSACFSYAETASTENFSFSDSAAVASVEYAGGTVDVPKEVITETAVANSEQNNEAPAVQADAAE